MSKYQFAPIALFAYRRVRHLSLALDALSACPEFADSRVFVFSDGPKDEISGADVAEVRAMLRARQTANMTIIEAPANRGLAASITAGTTQLCDEFGRAIVLEDDLIVSPWVLTWFNAALDKYAEDTRVWQIAAHQFDVPEFSARDEGIFLHLTTSWGWATWKRAWDQYDPMAKGWESLKTDKVVRRKFDLDNSYPFADMMIDQMNGRIDSWAIRWRWAVFCAGGVSLYPPRSLASNSGFDSTATHTRYRFLKRLLVQRDITSLVNTEKCPKLPAKVEASPADDAAVARALETSRRFTNRLLSALTR
jgi:hypothetical protein